MGENMCKKVTNYYQGIYLTETIMGNPNGDFIDNSPRNFDGKVFTTDKCIKYNVRKYIHDTIEDLESEKDIVFFYPRLVEGANVTDSSFLTRDDVYKKFFDEDFEKLLNISPDVRMFGGTFSFSKDPKQIYGPIQLSYGVDLNNAQIKRLQIGAPFATNNGQQTTNGSEYVVDDAIISYDIIINPNVFPGLLSEHDLNLFKEALWFGTNLRKSTSKKTDSKLLLLIKFKNDGNKTKCINIGELKDLINIINKKEHKSGEKIIKIDSTNLSKKLTQYKEYIECIEICCDKNEIIMDVDEFEGDIEIKYYSPDKLL